MKKEELKRELEDVKTIYVVGVAKGTNPRWDKGVWRKFSLYYIKNNELNRILIDPDEKDIPPNWVPFKKGGGGYFECSTLGVNRAFEIVYNFGRWLYNDGYRFKPYFLE